LVLDAFAYLQQLQALLPTGLAWVRFQSAYLSALLSAIAEEFARIDARIDDLINEADPRTTYELITDWERLLNLPDPCVTQDLTIDQRRAAIFSKLTMHGGQSRPYFIGLAEALGYAGATIDEYLPAYCDGFCDDSLWSEDDKWTWQLNLPSDGATYIATCDGPCDVPLQSWGDEVIECRINQYKPGHTTVLFAYV